MESNSANTALERAEIQKGDSYQLIAEIERVQRNVECARNNLRLHTVILEGLLSEVSPVEIIRAGSSGASGAGSVDRDSFVRP